MEIGGEALLSCLPCSYIRRRTQEPIARVSSVKVKLRPYWCTIMASKSAREVVVGVPMFSYAKSYHKYWSSCVIGSLYSIRVRNS